MVASYAHRNSVQSRSRASEVFDACVALQKGGELEAAFPGHRVQASESEGAFILVVDDATVCEGGVFEVASMFVTVRRALRDRARPGQRVGSYTRLRALTSVETAPMDVVSLKKR
jgi:hypothetical protein